MIKTVMKIIIMKYNYYYGLLSFLIYSFCFLIGPEEQSNHHFLMPLKAGLIIISAILFLFSCNEECSERMQASFSALSLVILFYEITLFAAVGRTILYIRDYPAIANSILWTVCSAVSFIRFRKPLFDIVHGFIVDKCDRALLIASTVIAVIVIALSIEPSGMRFSWDSQTLYNHLYHLDFDSLYDARQLMFMRAHVSVVYSYILVMLKLLFGSIQAAFLILNSICILAASIGTTFLFKTLVPGKKIILYALADALFMFSPWVCGMSTHNIYDYYIYCLFPLMMLFYLRNNWIGFFSIGVMISFSRVPGLIVFGGVCFMLLIRDILCHIRINIIKYAYFLSVAVVFLVYYFTGRNPDRPIAEITPGIDLQHIIQLTKMTLTCNFLWIFAILSVALIIRVFFVRKESLRSSVGSFVFIIIGSDILLFIFYCLAVTYKMPRYMDSHISIMYICGTLMLLSIADIRKTYALIAVILPVTFIGGFRTIDPVSLALFNNINVGDHDILFFDLMNPPYPLNDSIIYNREYYSYEALLNDALNYWMDDRNGDDELLLSLGDQLFSFGPTAGRYDFGVESGKHYFDLFYDKRTSGLANGYDYEYFNSPDMIPFEMHFIYSAETIEDAISSSPKDVFYYIYMPTTNNGRENEISKKYSIIDIEKFTFRGWQMNCIKFSKTLP